MSKVDGVDQLGSDSFPETTIRTPAHAPFKLRVSSSHMTAYAPEPDRRVEGERRGLKGVWATREDRLKPSFVQESEIALSLPPQRSGGTTGPQTRHSDDTAFKKIGPGSICVCLRKQVGEAD